MSITRQVYDDQLRSIASRHELFGQGNHLLTKYHHYVVISSKHFLKNVSIHSSFMVSGDQFRITVYTFLLLQTITDHADAPIPINHGVRVAA